MRVNLITTKLVNNKELTKTKDTLLNDVNLSLKILQIFQSADKYWIWEIEWKLMIRITEIDNKLFTYIKWVNEYDRSVLELSEILQIARKEFNLLKLQDE